MYEYEGVRRIVYGEGEYEGATFVPVCHRCGGFVKPDKVMRFQNDTISDGDYAGLDTTPAKGVESGACGAAPISRCSGLPFLGLG